MLKFAKIATVAAAVSLLGGCAVVASPVGNGMLMTQVKGPITVTPNAGASKVGQACAQNFLGLLAQGDASLEAAKKAGNITKVSAVDHDSQSILGVYAKFCTVVRGE